MPDPEDREIPSPYGSARDLPTYRDLAKQIQGGKLLTRFIGRQQRADFVRLEQDLNRLVNVVDRFYERLGPRNWIFHDSLDVSAIEALLDRTSTPEEAERDLIGLYRNPDSTAFRIGRLRNVNGLRERFHQIDRAREHYDAGQFDSAVLQLLAVMDGFVNDFEPERRQNLTSRSDDPDAMTAWDSVVGHHLGLTNALRTFRTSIKKRMDQEVFELYRNGIVHGTVTAFDNVVVATKAWNMLFAVVDWASATTKAKTPPKPEPSLRESLRKLVETTRTKANLEAWRPTTLATGEAGFEVHEMSVRTHAFLRAWQERNFGVLATFPSRQFSESGKSVPQIAGRLRERFDNFNLSSFQVAELENSVPAIWVTRGEAMVNDRLGRFECRWTIEEADGSLGWGSDTAEWRLVFCDPDAIWKLG